MQRFLLLFFISIIILSTNVIAFPLIDSIGIKKINQSIYILHKVEKKETLLGIAKKYHSDIAQILKANTKLKTLIINDTILIPLHHNNKQEKAKTIKSTHTVQKGETLFKIAKMYEMNVEHLIAINFLKENSALNTGQLLMIEVSENKKKQLKIVDQSINQWLFRPANDDDTPPPIVHIIQKDETLSNILKLYAINIDSLKKWNKNGIKIEAGERIIVGYREKTNNNTIPQNEKNIKPIKKEKGIGEMIVGSNNQTGKFLALHKSIPVGTMIKIVNPENNQSIEVRIIGKIPNLDSQRDVIIKLTKSACQEIGILNERFPIQLEYLK